MGKCFEHAQAEHLSFAQAQAERLLIRNWRVLLIIAQAEHLSFAQAQAEHLQNSLRECIQRFSQTILTPSLTISSLHSLTIAILILSARVAKKTTGHV